MSAGANMKVREERGFSRILPQYSVNLSLVRKIRDKSNEKIFLGRAGRSDTGSPVDAAAGVCVPDNTITRGGDARPTRNRLETSRQNDLTDFTLPTPHATAGFLRFAPRFARRASATTPRPPSRLGKDAAGAALGLIGKMNRGAV